MTTVFQADRLVDTDTSDWAGSPLSTVHHAPAANLSIPIERYPDGRIYVIRLELPGLDPARDVQVTVQTGILSVRATRQDQAPARHDSEFRYGTYARHIALPLGCNPRDMTASYKHGILTVRVGMEPEHDYRPHTVPVQGR